MAQGSFEERLAAARELRRNLVSGTDTLANFATLRGQLQPPQTQQEPFEVRLRKAREIRERLTSTALNIQPTPAAASSLATPAAQQPIVDPNEKRFKERQYSILENLAMIPRGMAAGAFDIEKGESESAISKWATEYQGETGTDWLARQAGFVAPLIIGGGIARAVLSAPTLLSRFPRYANLMASIAKDAPKLVKLGQGIAQAGIKGAATGGVTAAGQQLARPLIGEKAELSKIPEQAAEFAAWDIGLRGVGAGIKWSAAKVRRFIQDMAAAKKLPGGTMTGDLGGLSPAEASARVFEDAYNLLTINKTPQARDELRKRLMRMSIEARKRWIRESVEKFDKVHGTNTSKIYWPISPADELRRPQPMSIAEYAMLPPSERPHPDVLRGRVPTKPEMYKRTAEEVPPEYPEQYRIGSLSEGGIRAKGIRENAGRVYSPGDVGKGSQRQGGPNLEQQASQKSRDALSQKVNDAVSSGPAAAMAGLAQASNDPAVIKGAIAAAAQYGRRNIGAISDFLTKAKQPINRLTTETGKATAKTLMEADERYNELAHDWMSQLKKAGIGRFGSKYTMEDITNGKAPEINKVLDRIYGFFKNLGVDIGYRGPNYFPRSMTDKLANQISDDLSSVLATLEKSKGTEFAIPDLAIKKMLEKRRTSTLEYVEYLLKTKQAKSYSQAAERLHRAAQAHVFNEPGYLKERTLDLPASAWETNPKIVLNRYANRMSKYAAQVEKFGEQGIDLQKTLMLLSVENPKEADILRNIADIWSGEYYRQHQVKGGLRSLYDLYSNLTFLRLVLGGTATIPQLTQSFISTVNLGAANLGKGTLRLLTKGGHRQAAAPGVLDHSMAAELLGYESGSLTGKATRMAGEIIPFNPINRLDLLVASSSAEQAIRGWYKTAQGKGLMAKIPDRRQFARDRLKDFGIDWQKPLDDTQVLHKMYRFAVDSQMMPSPFRNPLVFNHPGWRPYLILKRFMWNQFAWQKEQLAREFKRAYAQSREGGGNVLMASGRAIGQGGLRTVVPTLRLAAGGYYGGEAVIWARNELESLLTGQEVHRKDEPYTLERFLNNLAAVGTFGVLTDLTTMASEIEKGTLTFKQFMRKIGWSLSPVIAEDFYKIFKEGNYAGLVGSLIRWPLQDKKEEKETPVKRPKLERPERPGKR